MVEGHGFEPWNPKEQIYSLPRLTTSLSLHNKKWCRQRESNPQPTDYKSVALPITLCRQNITKKNISCQLNFAFFLFFLQFILNIYFIFKFLGKILFIPYTKAINIVYFSTIIFFVMIMIF